MVHVDLAALVITAQLRHLTPATQVKALDHKIALLQQQLEAAVQSSDATERGFIASSLRTEVQELNAQASKQQQRCEYSFVLTLLLHFPVPRLGGRTFSAGQP